MQTRLNRILKNTEGKLFYKADCGHLIHYKELDKSERIEDETVICGSCLDIVKKYQSPLGAPTDLTHPGR